MDSATQTRIQGLHAERTVLWDSTDLAYKVSSSNHGFPIRKDSGELSTHPYTQAYLKDCSNTVNQLHQNMKILAPFS